MRMIFIDASGLGKASLEPNVIVAGAVIHGDKQWKAIGQYLSDMADEFVRPERRPGFVFHATELFSGGKMFPRDEYSKEERWHILDGLMSIPDKFDLPIVWGYTKRGWVEPGGKYHLSHPQIAPLVKAQGLAFSVAILAAENG